MSLEQQKTDVVDQQMCLKVKENPCRWPTYHYNIKLYFIDVAAQQIMFILLSKFHLAKKNRIDMHLFMNIPAEGIGLCG